MSIYRGAGGAGDAVADSASEALLVRELAIEVQADADAAQASATAAASSASGASSSASAASTSASNAATSATNASNSASSASTSATNAANSATAAQTAETAAELAETNAETAETNAASSASAASTSASNAATSATNASNSASAASTSATNASNSATAASTSASNASTSATNAASSASAASTSASNAATSETNAASSASSASTSATTATTQAGIATTKAGEAATSASNAATSATSASNSATTATTQATNASNSASAAATSATNASNSATSAATSATNAANSATAAATSESNAAATLSSSLLKANNLSDLTNTSTARTNLGVAIGSNVQAWDADLDTWATKTAPSGTVVGTSDTQTLTNKTLTTPVISSITNTGTLTLPTSTDTLVGRATTDTLTNKTLTNPTINGFTGDTSVVNLGSGQFYKDASGNVGIGTSSPTERLVVVNASTTAEMQLRGGTTAANYSQIGLYGGSTRNAEVSSNSAFLTLDHQNSGVINFRTGGSERMRIDSSGNVGIGTSSPAAKLDVDQTTVGLIARFRASDSSGRQLTITSSTTSNTGDTYTLNSTGGSGVLAFATSNTERMRIDSSGNLLVGTTTGTYRGSFLGTTSFGGISVAGYSAGSYYTMDINELSTGTQKTVRINRSGTEVGSIQTTASTTSYATSSDYRLKENIAPMTGALAAISALKPCTYTWKATGDSSQGFIAHELAEVCPEAVTGEKDAVDADGNIKPQGIDTSFLVATLTAAIQEQQVLIENLTTRLTALEGN